MSPQVVGVLGGMGPGATVEFMRRVLEATDASSDQDHIRLIVDSNPQVPDRTDFIMDSGPDPRPALLAMARGLERSGAEFLVMPCNTAHHFLADLEAAVAVPIVDWPLEVARAAVAIGVRRAGVLATSGTLAAGIYTRALGRFNIEEVVPGEAAQQALMRSIYQIKHHGLGGQAMTGIEGAAEELGGREIEACILACTEVSWACRGMQAIRGVQVLDAMDVVVRHVIERAGGRLKNQAAAGA